MRCALHRYVALTLVAVVAIGVLGCQDYAESLRDEAAQGDAQAQLDLGLLYRDGRGVPQDDAEAAQWYRMAAEQGHTEAQQYLSFAHSNGRGIPRNYVLAHMWAELAVSMSQGEQREEFARARRQIAQQMSPDQIAEAQRLAREWKPKTWDELKKGLEPTSR